jgi:hypothetical protein
MSLLLNPAVLPDPPLRPRPVLLLRAASARLLLLDRPHALVGHGGAAVAKRVLLLLLLLLHEQKRRLFAPIAWIARWLCRCSVGKAAGGGEERERERELLIMVGHFFIQKSTSKI